MKRSRRTNRRVGATLILGAILALPMQVAPAESCGDEGHQGAVSSGSDEGWCAGLAWCLDLHGADKCNSVKPILKKP